MRLQRPGGVLATIGLHRVIHQPRDQLGLRRRGVRLTVHRPAVQSLVDGVSGEGPIVPVPEPASLLLLAGGLALLANKRVSSAE